MTEMMKRVDDFVKSEEAYKSTELPKGEHPAKGYGAPYKGAHMSRIMQGGGPPKMNGYNTSSVWKPWQLEAALESGKLNHLFKDVRQRGSNRGRQTGNNSTNGKIINMVYVRAEGKKHKYQLGREEDWMNVPITFPPVQSDDVSDEPLIIKAELEGYLVQRVFVDQEQLLSMGKIELEVMFGSEGLCRRTTMKFTVVQASSPYNIILGRTGMRELRAIPSTTHPMMKFPTPRGIATLVPRTTVIFECHQLKEKQILLEELPKEGMAEEDKNTVEEEVMVNPAFPDQKADHPTLFECKCEHHPSGTKVKDSWFGKKQSSDEGSRIMDQGRYRKAACSKDYYPLPEIDLKIKAVMGFPFKCFLDAYKGYHQIQMAKEDEEKTTFYTDQGNYCYTKMSFGLKNARATYQRLVDSAFQAQLGRNLKAYVDDMVIKSKTEQEMIRDIVETFENLRKVNMKLNPNKCSFGVKEGKFLGYMVTSEGIRANRKKTKAVADMQSPNTLKEMQSFSGKLVALNRFLSKSAERALPFFETLKNITKENKDDFWWTEEAE
nr:hypothetical protein [Tanacetum cinerariifolium]